MWFGIVRNKLCVDVDLSIEMWLRWCGVYEREVGGWLFFIVCLYSFMYWLIGVVF